MLGSDWPWFGGRAGGGDRLSSPPILGNLGPVYMRKRCPGDLGHPLPRGKFTARLHGKKLPRVTESKLGSRLGDCEESQKM